MFAVNPGRCPGLGASALSGRVAAMDLDSVEHNLDEIVDGALVAGVGAEGTAVGDDMQQVNAL